MAPGRRSTPTGRTSPPGFRQAARSGCSSAGARRLTGGQAIRGGVPVIFPQFSMEGPLPRHGFARTRAWEFVTAGVEAGGASASFQLVDSAETRRIWPHPCGPAGRAGGAAQLELAFTVENIGGESFRFSMALHSYLRISRYCLGPASAGWQVCATAIHRGKRLTYPGPKALSFSGEVEPHLLSPPGPLLGGDGSHRTRIATQGLPTWWSGNPGEARAEPGRPGAGGYRRMLCIEAAQIEHPVGWRPGKRGKAARHWKAAASERWRLTIRHSIPWNRGFNAIIQFYFCMILLAPSRQERSGRRGINWLLSAPCRREYLIIHCRSRARIFPQPADHEPQPIRPLRISGKQVMKLADQLALGEPICRPRFREAPRR